MSTVESDCCSKKTDNSTLLAYPKTNSLLVILIALSTIVFIIFDLHYLFNAIHGIAIPPLILTLFCVKIGIELCCSVYVIAFVLISIFYLFMQKSPENIINRQSENLQSIAVFYLCANDIDLQSLNSLCGLIYSGKITLFVHDDSVNPEVNRFVDQQVTHLREKYIRDIRILRRAEKTGGKPGALNYLLSQIKDSYDYFLLCDNDSIALDPYCLEKAVVGFSNPDIAIVQFRNKGILEQEDMSINRILYRAVDVFHVFTHVLSKYGWQPFFGHNALLKTKYVLEAGGFTPGAFADDFDLTLRLNFRGYRVCYMPSIEFGEKHPPSYRAFRKRSYKWSYGCAQVLDKYAWEVIRTNKLSMAEKWGFFQLSFFYVFQLILLFYLFLAYLLLPYLTEKYEFSLLSSFVSGFLISTFIFLPLLVFGLKENLWKGLGKLTLLCGIVYGSTDLISAKGVWDHLRKKSVTWVPTNYNPVKSNAIPLVSYIEFLYGLALLAVPFWKAPQLLIMPTTYLFAIKFLSSPFLFFSYKQGV